MRRLSEISCLGECAAVFSEEHHHPRLSWLEEYEAAEEYDERDEGGDACHDGGDTCCHVIIRDCCGTPDDECDACGECSKCHGQHHKTVDDCSGEFGFFFFHDCYVEYDIILIAQR